MLGSVLGLALSFVAARSGVALLVAGVLVAGVLGGRNVTAQDATAQESGAAVAPQVLTVTLSGKLGTQELARCTRTLRYAEDNGAAWVVFVLDRDTGSFTEDQEDLQSLFDQVQATTVETVTYVKGRATQGACYLALLTSRTYFQRGAEIGEITKPESDWGDLFALDPDNAIALRLEEVKAAVRERLDGRKVKLRADAVKMALAMADPRVQLFRAVVREAGLERTRLLDEAELAALSAGGGRVLEKEPLTRPLFVNATEAEDAGLSMGTVDSLEHLTSDVLLVAPEAVQELEVNWAEDMIVWLELLAPFLLVAGFLLILVEVKTPGFGLPGILGVAFLALSMFHSYLVGLAEVTEIILFFLGIAALAVEIFLLPGMLIFGAAGFVCLVLSLVLSRQSFVWPSNAVEEGILLANLMNLTLLFVLVLVLGFFTWRLLPKVPFFNRAFLRPPNAGGDGANASQPSGLGLPTERLTALVGRTGVAVTLLRPTGTMAIDGDRIDVVTEGEYHEVGTPLRVLYVQGNRVVVGANAQTGSPGSEGPSAQNPSAQSPPAENPSSDNPGESGSVGVVFLLLIVGLVLLVAEVFFVSFGVIGLLAGVTLIGAVFAAFQESTGFGMTILVVEAIAAPVVLTMAFRILPKTPFGKQLILAGPKTQGHAAAADRGLSALVGQSGETLSDLRPAGFARIDGRKIDVVTRGEMIARATPIKVLEVSGNRVVVAATD